MDLIPPTPTFPRHFWGPLHPLHCTRTFISTARKGTGYTVQLQVLDIGTGGTVYTQQAQDVETGGTGYTQQVQDVETGGTGYTIHSRY